MQDKAQKREIDANYDYFQRQLGALLEAHRGAYALLKSCHVEGFFAKPGDAYRAGMMRFPDGVFSIQEVTDEPLHLGFMSLAGA